jgi:hypothetical protein
MATISITPMLNEKTNEMTYITAIKHPDKKNQDNEDEIMGCLPHVPKGNYVKLPDNSEQIHFVSSELPYKVLPRLTGNGTIILELTIDQFVDLRHKLSS